MERDESWNRVFERLPVLECLQRDGVFHVTADELKAHGAREPRLMAKIDTLAQRPAALARHGVAIFPVRNGRYALFPDPDSRSFFRFGAEGVPPPARPFRSTVDLDAFDTYPRDQESGESQALDFAFLTSLLPHFCNDDTMRLTLRGRFFSGGFRFTTPLGRELEVASVQIEVDAGYEGKERIYLVEAKRGRREDFHIRQLWYPWMHWRARTRKTVVPIFFSYSNGQYFLTEFAIGETFGDLRIVRNRCYSLEESPLAELNLPGMLAATPEGREPDGSFPQANDLDRVIDLVQIAGAGPAGKARIARVFDFEERQADYYGSAGVYLGLLARREGAFEATEEGRALLAVRGRAGRTTRLVGRMLGLPSLRECIGLLVARNYRLEKIAQGELADVIRRHGGLGASTPERRASTARSWLAWIMRNIQVRFSLDNP